MFVINFLDWFYGLSWPIILAVGWVLTPLGLFAVALIGESRFLHLGKGCSRMFFPCDFGLGIMLTGVALLTQKGDLRVNVAGALSAFVIGAAIFLINRLKCDAPRYPKRSRNSPTKIYHDLVGYWAFASLLITPISSPVADWIMGRGWSLSLSWTWLVVLLGLVIWQGGAVYDSVAKNDTDENLLLRHPSDWQPIWRTRRISKR